MTPPANRKWRVRRPGVSWWAESPSVGLRHHVETQPFPTWREAMDYAMRATSARTDAIGRPLSPLYSPGGYSPMETK